MNPSAPDLKIHVKTPFYLNAVITSCTLFGKISAGIQFFSIRSGLLKMPLYLVKAKKEAYGNLKNIWSSRLLRRILSVLVRSPLRSDILKLVNSTVQIPADRGCIVVICHTPWKRVLVQWCLENNFGLIIGSNRWIYRKKLIQRQGKGFKEMREMVQYLRNKGRIVVAADVFNGLNDCPVEFLGDQHNLSLLPARLARSASVPLISVIPVLNEGTINIYVGESFNYAEHLPYTCGEVMLRLISFFETEIKNDPSIWPWFVK